MKFHKTYRLRTVLIFFTVIVSFNVYAAGLPWDDHSEPFDFRFGNHFDDHQQSKVNGGNDKLVGFLYITITGYNDLEDLIEADHGIDTVGWVLDGVPARAKLIDKSADHPIWCLDPEDIPRSQGYTHFHWEDYTPAVLVVGQPYDGYLLKLTAIDSFFFLHGDGFVVTPGIDYDSHYNIVTTDTDCQ